MVVTDKMSWHDAQSYAKSLGGHLVTISDEAENTFVADLAREKGVSRDFWIGLTDEVVEGNFVWVTGEPLDFTFWGTGGEPNDYGSGEDYVSIGWTSKYRWNDMPIRHSKPFVVEYDSPPPTDGGDVATPKKGLVGYWNFDEGSGNTARDSSGNGNDGTIQGATRVDGRCKKALSFDGDEDSVQIPHTVINNLLDITFSAWIKTSGRNFAGILSGANSGDDEECSIWITSGGKLRPCVKGNDLHSEKTINDGLWHHISVVREGSSGIVKIFIDGQLDNTNTESLATGNLNIDLGGLWLGREQDCVGGCWEIRQDFDGIIDEVRIYNYALTQSEIQGDMNACRPGDTLVKKPDLEPYEITWTPLNPTTSDSITITWKVRNGGDADAVGKFYTELYVDDERKKFCEKDGLGVGQETSGSMNVGKLLYAGEHKVTVKTDATGAISESNEGNNECSRTLTVTGTGTATPKKGLVGYWKFNEGSEKIAHDSSGNGNDGTIQGATWVENGGCGKALSFDGRDDYVEVPHSSTLDVTSKLTISAWIRLNSISKVQGIVEKRVGHDTQYSIYVRSYDEVGFYFQGGSVHQTNEVNLQTGQWYHVASVFDTDANNVKIYVDGVQKLSEKETGEIISNTNKIRIGRGADSGEYFNGIVDEVRIYNYARSQEQIKDDIKCSPSTPMKPLLCTDPDSLTHDFGAVPEDQTRDWTFDIKNCGEGKLTWTVNADRDWITVTPTSGSTTTETDTVTVSIDTTGLECGKTYTGTITVSSDGETKEGTITVYVPEPGEPALCTEPDSLTHDFGSVPEDQTRDWTFDIKNCGAGTLTWTVSDNRDWITVNPTSGSTTTETDTVTVSIDTTGLERGKKYTGTITVSSDDGETKQGTITVYVPEPGVFPPLFYPIIYDNNWNANTWDYTDTSTWTLDKSVFIEEIWIHYNGDPDETVSYVIKTDGVEFHKGNLVMGPSTYPGWYRGMDTFDKVFPAGTYVMTLSKAKQCQNFYSNGNGYVRLFSSAVKGTGFDDTIALSDGQTLSGDIVKDGEVYYKFYLSAGQRATVTLQPLEGDQDLYIFNPTRHPIEVSGNSGTETEECTVTADTSGWYYAMVHGYEAGRYTITLPV